MNIYEKKSVKTCCVQPSTDAKSANFGGHIAQNSAKFNEVLSLLI